MKQKLTRKQIIIRVFLSVTGIIPAWLRVTEETSYPGLGGPVTDTRMITPNILLKQPIIHYSHQQQSQWGRFYLTFFWRAHI